MNFYKVLVTSVLFNYLFGITNAQTPVIQWQKTYGGTLDDEAYSICTLSNGSYVIVGGSGSTDGDVTNHHGIIPGFYVPDFWLIKLDSLGNLLWNKCYGGDAGDLAKSLIQTLDGGFIMAGYTNSNDGDVIGGHFPSDDFWIVKTDSLGNLQWQKCLGASETEGANQIIQTKDSGYLVIGETNSYDGDVNGSHGGTDVWVVKLNSNGVKQWAKCFGGWSLDVGTSCKQTTDGGFLIAGSTNSTDGDVSGQHNFIFADFWVIKLDSIGNLKWQRCYGGTSDDFPAELMLSNDGGAYIFGTTSSSDGDVTGLIGSLDFWLFKIDSIGNILWQKCFGGIYPELAKAISPTFDGGIVMIGDAVADNGMVSGTHGSSDYWICKIDSSGNFEWGKALGGTEDEHPYAIKETLDGGYLVAGSTTSFDGDIASNHGSKDYWIVKLAPLGLSIPEVENSLMELNIFQNNDQLNLRFFSKHKQNAQLFLYDVNGKKVNEKSITVNEGVNYNSLNCAGFARGMYFANIDGEKGSLRAKVFIQ